MSEGQHSSAAKMVAWACFLFGTFVSVGFNVLTAFLTPAGAGAGWRPDAWTVIGAAVWPLALLGSIELLARVPWPDTLFAKLVRYGAMGLVAVFAAMISYQHIREVLLSWRYNELSANVGPLVIDGLMILAGYAMVVGSKGGQVAHVKTTSAPVKPEPEQIPDFSDMLKPLPAPKPAPRHRTNGIKPAQVRKSAGPTPQEIAGRLRENGTTMTKREIQTEFSVGGAKAQEALNLLKEGDDQS